MTSLDRLIQRLMYPPKIALEDAFDTVKEFWDDVTKGYWSDTDEQLQEELGVSPATLSELLEPTRHTFDYANLGGNSGVRGYDQGEDWILVMFADGTRYLYTVKSAPPESITYMKELALAGKGLNSYITRIQRTNYAGRNVKGEILIKPGMEHHNPMGYHRLKLIEAFRNTMTHTEQLTYPTFSNEDSEEDILSKMRDWLIRLGKWLAKMATELWRKMTSTLESVKAKAEEIIQYTKDRWFTSYTVTVPAMFNELAMTDGKLDYDKFKGRIDQVKAKIDKLYRVTTAKNPLDSLNTYAVSLTKQRAEVERTKQELQKEFDALGSGESVKLTVEASDLPTIKKIAEYGLDLELVNRFKTAMESRRDELQKLNGVGQIAKAFEPKLLEKITQNIETLVDDLTAVLGIYNKQIAAVIGTVHTIMTKAKQASNVSNESLAGSIKGKVAVENISNEGIFDSLKRMFGVGKPETSTAPAQATPKEVVYIWDRAAAIEKAPPTALDEATVMSPIFQQNGQFNPNWISRLEQDIAQYEKITKDIITNDKKVASWVKKWEPKLDEFSGDNNRKDEFMQVVKAWVASQPKAWGETFVNNHEFLGWGKYRWEAGEPGFAYSPMQPGSRVTVPPLDPNSTKRVVQLIAKLGKLILFGLGEDLTYVGYDFSDAPFRGYMMMDDDLNTALSGLKYHAHSAESPRDHYEVIEARLEAILKDLVGYVESSKSNGVGMETYKQTTLRKYRNQIATAGNDGLDPTARQFMTVGLESMGLQRKVTMESFNTTTAGPTEHLHNVIDGALRGSMEGILDGIRKFFSPSKDKDIYATVNKGFLQDLSNEVKKYTNIQWVKDQGVATGKTVDVEGANLIPEYDKVVDNFIKECHSNRAKHHEIAETAFNNMDEVLQMIAQKKLTSTENVSKAVTIMKATRQLKAPRPDVPKVSVETGTVKTLSAEEIVAKATKLLKLFETLGADTKYVKRWNDNYINSHKYRDWKYVGPSNSKELSDHVKDYKFVELYTKTLENLNDLSYIGAEFHKLKPYIMAEFQLIEKSVAN